MIVLGTSYQKARKRHLCDSCGGHIEAGHEYMRQRVVDGGDAWVYKAHMHCERASKILADFDIIGDDGVWQNVSDCDREDRATVWAADPETYRACWPGAPDLTDPAPPSPAQS